MPILNGKIVTLAEMHTQQETQEVVVLFLDLINKTLAGKFFL